MKKLLFIIALGFTVNCFGQKADTSSVTLCELELIDKGLSVGGIYNVSIFSPTVIDGFVRIDNGKYKMEIQPLGKLAAQGWHVVSYHSTSLGGIYILEKPRKE